jgi:hypothetical protein
MKRKIGPLSITGIFAAFLLFSACNTTFFPSNTTIKTQSEKLTAVNLTEKRVLIVSYDSELTREFVISLKNYLREELKGHKVIAERINIRQNETAADLSELDKLKSTFTPDYLLTIKVRDERTRKMYLFGGNVKTLRGMTLDFNVFPVETRVNEGVSQWRSAAVINHFYKSETVGTAKKMAAELAIKMQKDLLVN